jgi:hypothetical protein
VKSNTVSVFVLAGALARFDFFGHAAQRVDVLASN